MNNDLIRRSALIDIFSNTLFFDEDSKCKALELINNAPTIKTYVYFERRCGMSKERPFEDITPEPQGEWGEPFEHLGNTYHKCPCCCFGIKISDYDNFCPNCGADMRQSNKSAN